MSLPSNDPRGRFVVILSRPRKNENIGMAARALKNTGFSHLRLVAGDPPGRAAVALAVHAEDILERARTFPSLEEAAADCQVVFAAVARHRKNFPADRLDAAVERMLAFPERTRIGLLFGNERTGLTSDELMRSNFRFTIPQAFDQPSYNLAAAVLLTLFPLFIRISTAIGPAAEPPLPRAEQELCIHRILDKLEAKRFFDPQGREHIQDRVYDLFGRLALTAADRDLLLAIFAKGPDKIRAGSE